VSERAKAEEWLLANDVSRETIEKLADLVRFIEEENAVQNLVSGQSLSQIWTRHILDSAQLVRFVPKAGSWLDLGTGAGFPGLVAGLLHEGPVTLVEERRLRSDFLSRVVERLDLCGHVFVAATKVQRLDEKDYDIISARAFAPLNRLLEMGLRFATPSTRWVLPKGRNAETELAALDSSWQGAFRLEPSITDDNASIIIADSIHRRSKGSNKGDAR